MLSAIRAPRVNGNDDVVVVSRVHVRVGDAVRAGDVVADVVTEKAACTVEAAQAGYVVGVCALEDQAAAVGSVLVWTADTPEERPPTLEPSDGAADARAPSLKARLLLAQHGIDPAAISPAGDRLMVADVEQYLARASRMQNAATGRATTPASPERSVARGRIVPLPPHRRAMSRTVQWHRTAAVPAYVECRYDDAPWRRYADAFQSHHGLLMPPLLALMAWRLAQIAGALPDFNATVIDDDRYLYDAVNIGVTIQTDTALYLTVVHGANCLSPRDFCDRLLDLQRRAVAGTLAATDLSDATIAFSSMARWNVSRHIGVLLPYTSVMVAHAAAPGADACLGATYDHRLLAGGEVADLLQGLACPPDTM